MTSSRLPREATRPARAVLVVGVDESPPPPLCFGLPGTPDFRGFEVDLLDALAVWLDVQLDCRSELWSVAMTALQRGALDMVCTAATITPRRRQVVDFSDPYFEADLALVARRSHPARWDDPMAGKTIGVRVATTAEDFVRAQRLPAAVRTFDFNVDAYQALRDGQVDAVVDDEPIGAYFARSLDGLQLVGALPGTRFEYGLVFAKGNDRLRGDVNQALAALKAEGTRARLYQRWFVDEGRL
jgi:ABC-type amino acid transport substrate-binding protein